MLNVVYGIVVLTATVVGVSAAYSLEERFIEDLFNLGHGEYPVHILMGILLGGISYLVAATASWELGRWMRPRLSFLSAREVLWGAVGLLSGLLVANLLWLPLWLSLRESPFRETIAASPILAAMVLVFPIFLNLLFGLLGVVLFTKDQGSLSDVLEGGFNRRPQGRPKLLDTSAIIDGRLLPMVRTHTLEGPLLVPRFVLNELHHVSDSPDPVKRAHGRQGLEHLKELKTLASERLSFPQDKVGSSLEVDEQLIRYAQATGARLVTVDHNLAKLAGLQGVDVLALNEIANALRRSLTAGDHLDVALVKAGKEEGQGVGYLEDGTMIVVDGGGDSLGETVGVEILRVLQTSAGRMAFAHLLREPPHEESETKLAVVTPARGSR